MYVIRPESYMSDYNCFRRDIFRYDYSGYGQSTGKVVSDTLIFSYQLIDHVFRRDIGLMMIMMMMMNQSYVFKHRLFFKAFISQVCHVFDVYDFRVTRGDCGGKSYIVIPN